jgi:iron(III) transport system ATP-binding protein
MITIRQVKKAFLQAREREVVALDGVDLQFEDEEFFVLLGPSGSGKTTLLRCVAGLERPDEGEILLGTKLVYSSSRRLFVPPEERGLGMVFQSYAIWPHMTVLENVVLPLTHGPRGLSKSLAKEKAMRALAMVQMAGLEGRPVPLLSGGQQQRVALARALAVEPAVLLMDEPLSNLDARLREEVRAQIKSVAREVGVAVLYVTHDQAEAMALADRIAVMAGGRILQIGSAHQLYRSPANPRVAEFFGSMNWLKGETIDESRVKTAIGVLKVPVETRLHGPVILGIRPEDIKIGQALNNGENTFEGCLVEKTFLGDQVILELKINDESLSMKMMADAELPGKTTSVHFSSGRIVVFPEAEASNGLHEREIVS